MHNPIKDFIQQKVVEEEQKATQKDVDPWRLSYHLMPPTGWLNDPNGLCQYNGKYHVFFQYAPFDANGGLKLWGEYTSDDLLHWNYEGAPLLPDSPYDCHGVYSGSALIDDGSLEVFYTGNVKFEGAKGEHDYIHSGREAYVIHAARKAGKDFDHKTCLLSSKDYPSDYTNHVRDPKVWKEGNEYYMILGGRKKGDKGAVMLYHSFDKKKWEFTHEITTQDAFGYMWECPDLFELEGEKILSVSPQGLMREEFCYQNRYQSGYFFLKDEKLSQFREWDMGFDFYAPQTFVDEKGRRILIGWVGVPDTEAEYQNKTVEKGWQHALTVPRQLELKGDKVLQYPVEEIAKLRKERFSLERGEEHRFSSKCLDIEVEKINAKTFVMNIAKDCELRYAEGIFTLSMKEVTSMKEAIGAGRTKRKAKLETLENMRILVDTSMIEIFINDGECVFTSRFYPEGEGCCISFEGDAGDVCVFEMK